MVLERRHEFAAFEIVRLIIAGRMPTDIRP